MRICRSPWLIAACRVLHRLLMPRHSPCALCRLNFPSQPFRVVCCSLFELLEFHKQIFIGIHIAVQRFYPSSYIESFPPCGEIVIKLPFFGKTKFSLTIANLVKFCPLNLFVSTLQYLYSVFNEHYDFSFAKIVGRSGWTRTIDLALIRRAL